MERQSTGPGSQAIGIETDVQGIADQTAVDTSGIDTSGIGQGVGATGGLSESYGYTDDEPDTKKITKGSPLNSFFNIPEIVIDKTAMYNNK